MTISVDLDNTWTADPDLWRSFRAAAMSRGHEVIMITARTTPLTSDEIVRYALPSDMKILYSAGAFKEKAAVKAGVKVDIWVDDIPGTVQHIVLLPSCPDTDL